MMRIISDVETERNYSERYWRRSTLYCLVRRLKSITFLKKYRRKQFILKVYREIFSVALGNHWFFNFINNENEEVSFEIGDMAGYYDTRFYVIDSFEEKMRFIDFFLRLLDKHALVSERTILLLLLEIFVSIKKEDEFYTVDSKNTIKRIWKHYPEQRKLVSKLQRKIAEEYYERGISPEEAIMEIAGFDSADIRKTIHSS